MKKIHTQSIKITTLSFYLLCSIGLMAQAGLSREEIALEKAEARVENYRLKLVELKRQIDSADSLYVAGEVLEESSKIQKMEARDEIKAIEKKYKSESKVIKKRVGSKDRGVASDAKAELKGLTAKYKIDLKEAQNKLKTGEKGVTSAGRMIEKADKKLDLLAGKLKTAENAYVEAEEALNEKKGIKK